MFLKLNGNCLELRKTDLNIIDIQDNKRNAIMVPLINFFFKKLIKITQFYLYHFKDMLFGHALYTFLNNVCASKIGHEPGWGKKLKSHTHCTVFFHVLVFT